jgi:hypothetical protein
MISLWDFIFVLGFEVHFQLNIHRILTSLRGAQIPGDSPLEWLNFAPWHPTPRAQLLVFFPHIQKHVPSSWTLNRKCQITVRFTCQYRTSGSWHRIVSSHATGSCNFEVVPRFLENLWAHDFTVDCTNFTPHASKDYLSLQWHRHEDLTTPTPPDYPFIQKHLPHTYIL